ncbi:MAG: PIG-L family deacetylase [Spirochaetota bacterium]|nr:PIG-L family deacetylase [Spirochaetota bacterium]
MIDILAISPHPDDAEIGCGGLLLASKKRAYKTGILHLTLGEMGTGGDEEIRKKEIDNAARLLELDYVNIVGFKDCQITDSHENRLLIAEYIRKLKPKIVLIPYWTAVPGRGIGHTDHLTTGIMASHAVNFARLHKMPIEGEPHSVQQVLYYLFPRDTMPSLVVDITHVANQWLKAIKSHHSQMFGKHAKQNRFYEMIVSSAKTMGYQIRARYGQGFVSASPLNIPDPFVLIDKAK